MKSKILGMKRKHHRQKRNQSPISSEILKQALENLNGPALSPAMAASLIGPLASQPPRSNKQIMRMAIIA